MVNNKKPLTVSIDAELLRKLRFKRAETGETVSSQIERALLGGKK